MKSNTEHQIAIVVKYHGPTNNRGSRISMTLPRFDSKRVFASWDYREGTSSNEQAEHWLHMHGIACATLFDMHSHYVIGCHWSQREVIFKAFSITEKVL